MGETKNSKPANYIGDLWAKYHAFILSKQTTKARQLLKKIMKIPLRKADV